MDLGSGGKLASGGMDNKQWRSMARGLNGKFGGGWLVDLVIIAGDLRLLIKSSSMEIRKVLTSDGQFAGAYTDNALDRRMKHAKSADPLYQPKMSKEFA
jgi:hypothetical protein